MLIHNFTYRPRASVLLTQYLITIVWSGRFIIGCSAVVVAATTSVVTLFRIFYYYFVNLKPKGCKKVYVCVRQFFFYLFVYFLLIKLVFDDVVAAAADLLFFLSPLILDRDCKNEQQNACDFFHRDVVDDDNSHEGKTYVFGKAINPSIKTNKTSVSNKWDLFIILFVRPSVSLSVLTYVCLPFSGFQFLSGKIKALRC